MRAARDAHVSMTAPSPNQIQKRRVKEAMNRLLWNEAEGDQEEYDVLLEDLDARLYEAEDAEGFADLPIEVLAETLARDMRLSGEMVITTAKRFTPYLPRVAAGGGPSAEERMVEGASLPRDAALYRTAAPLAL